MQNYNIFLKYTNNFVKNTTARMKLRENMMECGVCGV